MKFQIEFKVYYIFEFNLIVVCLFFSFLMKFEKVVNFVFRNENVENWFEIYKKVFDIVILVSVFYFILVVNLQMC